MGIMGDCIRNQLPGHNRYHAGKTGEQYDASKVSRQSQASGKQIVKGINTYMSALEQGIGKPECCRDAESISRQFISTADTDIESLACEFPCKFDPLGWVIFK